MSEEKVANDNRLLEYGTLDPDRHYVNDYMDKALQHFEQCKIHPETVNNALCVSIKTLQIAEPEDENGHWANLNLLWDVQARTQKLIDQNMEGLRQKEQRRIEAKQAASEQPDRSG